MANSLKLEIQGHSRGGGGVFQHQPNGDGGEEGTFRVAYDRGFGRLKISLRRQQIESAKAGNTAMLT